MKNTELGPAARPPTDSEEARRLIYYMRPGYCENICPGTWDYRGAKAVWRVRIHEATCAEATEWLKAFDAALGEARGTASASEQTEPAKEPAGTSLPQSEKEPAEQGALRASLDDLRADGQHTALKLKLAGVNDILDATRAALQEARGYLAKTYSYAALPMLARLDSAILNSAPAAPSGDAPTAPPAPDLLRENARLREERDEAVRNCQIMGASGAMDALTNTTEALTSARAAHLENAELLAKAQGRAATMEAAIRWALGEQPSRDGRWFDSAKFGWREGLRVPPFWWRTFLRLFSEVDLGGADRKGNAAQPPLEPAAAAAPAKEGK